MHNLGEKNKSPFKTHIIQHERIGLPLRTQYACNLDIFHFIGGISSSNSNHAYHMILGQLCNYFLKAHLNHSPHESHRLLTLIAYQHEGHET